MNGVSKESGMDECMMGFEFDVVQFIMRAAKSGQYTKLAELQERLKVEFPECSEDFIGQCIEKVGRSLR